MQTHFSPAQLADPDIAEAERILRTCVHCGFCTATCPTFQLLGDELDSPRGRIYQIKDMLEHDRPADAATVKHIDRCLTCLSCMTTCPSGVHYMHLVDHARTHIAETHDRPWPDRALRAILAQVVPNPAIFRLALFGAWLGKPIARFLPGRLKAVAGMAPSTPPLGPAPLERPQTVAAEGARKLRVALMPGCAQAVLAPEINEAAARLLARHGAEVVIAEGGGCCGALVHHMGETDKAHAQAAANIAAWRAEIEAGGLDAIVITASGCGTTVKDYGFMLRNDPLAEDAATISALAKDVSEVMAELGLKPPTRDAEGLSVAYHSACSMQHGQKITETPKILLKAAGFDVREPAEGHLCCGSAGVYNLLQPDLATELRDRKAANIAATTADLIATGNIGCMTQLAPVAPAPIVHTVELLDWATGGPPPPAARGVAPL